MLANSATLVSLEIGQLGLSKKDSDLTKKAHTAAGITDNRAGYYRKFLLSKAEITPIFKTANFARSYHRYMTVPWGHDKYRLLPSKLILKYTAKIKEFKIEFFSHVDDLVQKWPFILTEAQRILGTVYDPADYPMQSELKSHYKFNVRFKPIPQDDHFILQVEEKTLQEMKESLNKEQDDNLQSAMSSLWHRLFEVVDRMATRLDDSNPRIYKTLVTNIEDLVKLLPDLNISNDPQLTDMCNQIENKLCVFTPGQLKKDNKVKTQVAKDAADIRDKMNVIMGVK